MYDVKDGVVSEHQPAPNDKAGAVDDDEVTGIKPDEATERFLNESYSMLREVEDRELPRQME